MERKSDNLKSNPGWLSWEGKARLSQGEGLLDNSSAVSTKGKEELEDSLPPPL